MESQPQTKRQYDQYLQLYSKRRSDNQQQIKIQNELQNALELLKKQLLKPIAETNCDNHLNGTANQSQFEQAIQRINEDLNKIKGQLFEQEKSFNKNNVSHTNLVSQLNSKNYSLSQQLNGSNQNVGGSKNVDQHNLKQLSAVVKLQEQEKRRLVKINKQIQNEQKQLSKLQKEIQNSPKAQRKDNKSDLLSHKLQEELALLQTELSTLNQGNNKQKCANKPQYISKNDKTQSPEQELCNLTYTNKQLQEKQATLKNKLSSFKDNIKVGKLNDQIAEIQKNNEVKEKEIGAIVKVLNEKQAQIKKHREENKKDKKKDKNHKQQILEQSGLFDTYSKEYERQKEKYESTAKLVKTYVNQENLQILQKEYQRHQGLNKLSLQQQQARKDKYLRQNALLKERILKLKALSSESQEENAKKLREAKIQGDELIKEKLGQQKALKQNTTKLNEYMKEFPDHDKKKQQQKAEEKRRKLQQKQRIKQTQALERLRLKQLNAKDEEQNEKAEPSYLPISNNPTEFYNNDTFRLVMVVGAVILMGVLFYLTVK